MVIIIVDANFFFLSILVCVYAGAVLHLVNKEMWVALLSLLLSFHELTPGICFVSCVLLLTGSGCLDYLHVPYLCLALQPHYIGML